MTAEYLVTVLRKHIEKRRAVISEKWPKHLPPDAYAKNIGAHEELELAAEALQEAVQRMNAAEDDDLEDETQESP